MFARGKKARTIATIGLASALVLGAGGTAFGAHSLTLSSAALTSTVSTESVKPAEQKLGLDAGSDSSAKDGKSAKSAKKNSSTSSRQLENVAARTLPVHTVSEADALEKKGAALDEKLADGKAVDAERYLKVHEKLKWKSSIASTYGEGDGLMGSSCSDGSTVTASSMGVAHKTLELGTKILIRYGDKIVEATVCDRGPFVKGREIDLQPAVSRALGFSGVGTVKYLVVD